MLILLAAAQVPALRDMVRDTGPTAGKHLLELLEGWTEVIGGSRSPSVDQSIHIIREASRYLEELPKLSSPRKWTGSLSLWILAQVDGNHEIELP